MDNTYSSNSSDPRDRAKSLLIYYLELLALNKLQEVNGDNVSEIAGVVDDIIDAAVEAVEAALVARQNS